MQAVHKQLLATSLCHHHPYNETIDPPLTHVEELSVYGNSTTQLQQSTKSLSCHPVGPGYSGTTGHMWEAQLV